MVAVRLADRLKASVILVVALITAAESPAVGEEMRFDRGLPDEPSNHWDKSSDLNFQFGEALELANGPAASDEDEMTLVEIVHNLNDAGFLTGEAYYRALREVEQGVIQLRSQLLSIVGAQSIPQPNNGGSLGVIVPIEDEAGLNEEQIQAVMEQFEELGISNSSTPNLQLPEQTQEILDRLNETGVLSERAYTALQNSAAYTGAQVFVGRSPIETRLYHDAANQMRLDEALNPELAAPQLKQWREAKIISDSGYAALMQALKDAALDNPIEFLRYLDKALLFDLQAYPLDPKVYYPDIHQTVAQRLAESGVLDSGIGVFELEFVLNVDSDQAADSLPSSLGGAQSALKSYDAVISAQVDGRTYQQASYYGKLDDRPEAVARISSEGIINFFNKILRDQASLYRLYSVSDRYGIFGLYDSHRFGIIALTEAQARIYFGDWYETDYETTLTSDRIEEILALFKQIGLLDHLNEAEMAEGRRRIARNYITEPQQLLAAFKDVVMFFDWESGNVDNPYQALTEEFAALSRGNFNPTDISNGYDRENQSASQSFTLNGTQYSTDLEFNGDWLDPKFFDFIEATTAAEVAQGQFYRLSGGLGYIFLSEAQFEALRSQQLINLTPGEN